MIVLQFVGRLLRGSMVGVNGDLLQDGLCHRVQYTEPLPLQQATADPPSLHRRYSHSSGSVSVGFLSSAVHKAFFEPSRCHWWVWDLILKEISPLLLSCLGFSFALRRGVSFFGGIQHSVDGCSAPSCNFGLLSGEDEGMTFYSSILYGNLWSDSRNTERGYPRDFLVLGKIESRWRKGPQCKKQLDGITN